MVASVALGEASRAGKLHSVRRAGDYGRGGAVDDRTPVLGPDRDAGGRGVPRQAIIGDEV
jgi:hypothetical protein